MHRSLLSVLSALAVCLTVSASPSPIVPRVPDSQGTILRPIAIRDFEAAAGVQRRAAEDFSNLNLQTQSQLIYGNSGADGKLVLANMTLYAPDGLEMVLMEEFDGLTSAVDCQGDDGTISLTFSSPNAFNYALQQWAHINDSDDGKFLLIANHDGCGPEDQRQPYLISKITEDGSTSTTYLTSQAAPWSDIAATYDLDFGQTSLYTQTSQLKKRGLISDLEGNFNESKSVTFDISTGTKGQVSSIYSDSEFNLNCINCFTTGSFELTGHLVTDHWSLSELTLTASPQDFQAELELEVNITANESPNTLQFQKQLFSSAIPGAGISIPEIFTLGATLSYSVGGTASFQGTASVDFGLSATLPDSAQLVADIKNPDSSSATGFNGGTLTPLFNVNEMSAAVTLGAYSLPMISFGVSLVKIGSASLDVSVKLPEVDVTLTAEYDQGGVCSGSSSDTGVKLDSTLDIEVDLEIEGTIDDLASKTWSEALFSTTEPLFSTCFPLSIPGLGPSNTVATTLPTLPPSLSQSQFSVTPTHIYSAPSGKLVPIVNGTSYIIAPSGASLRPTGVLSSGTGQFALPTGSPLYSSSGLRSSPSTQPASGIPPLISSTGSALSNTFAAHSSPASSGTAVSQHPSATLASLQPIRRAATGEEGCKMAKRFGKRVLVC